MKHSNELNQLLVAFIVNDQTALRALQMLHERVRELSDDHSCPKHLYYLAEDLRQVIDEASENFKGLPTIEDAMEVGIR